MPPRWRAGAPPTDDGGHERLAGETMLDTIRKLYALLDARERRKGAVVAGLALVTSLVEMVGVASILPFLAVLANPEVVESNRILAWLYDGLGFETTRGFLVFLGAAVLGFIVFSLLVRLASSFAIARFSNMRAYSLSSQLVENYLRQPYAWFLDRNSVRLCKTVLIEVDRVVSGGLIPAMRLLADLTVALSLVGLLLLVSPVAALLAAGLFGGSYVIIFIFARRTLARIGEIILKANLERHKAVQEAMTGIKDVKVLGVEENFLRRYQAPARRIARTRALAAVIGETPRYVLEAIAVGSTLVLILFLLSRESNTLIDILPTLGVFAFAGVRMFPALQAIYRSVGSLKVAKSAVDELYADMTETHAGAEPRPWRTADGARAADDGGLRLNRTLALEGIGYAYPAAERSAIAGLDLVIAAKSRVGIVGGTGAGKTTLVDVMLGLLLPQEGRIVVDGVPVTRANLRAWQARIGYVPQAIFLTDDTVAANIAFGVPPAEIDMAAVARAARIAELDRFVIDELPQGYLTRVGDRGIRLSGGQRQRIGIARALYHDPDVLILDEATSALDNLTEKAVMDAVHNLGQAKTIVMIAHRLSTVRGCDTIVMMEAGRITATGAYDDLLGKSPKFRAMAGIA
jgi:ABC-type bacteriocin/lantibiotic exporter with double-glycine peptidase domain